MKKFTFRLFNRRSSGEKYQWAYFHTDDVTVLTMYNDGTRNNKYFKTLEHNFDFDLIEVELESGDSLDLETYDGRRYTYDG